MFYMCMQGTNYTGKYFDHYYGPYMYIFTFFLAVISFNLVQYTVNEDASTVQLQLVKIGSLNIPVTVTVSTMNGTAVG